MKPTKNPLIKSKKRVADHGEVFTPLETVRAMIKLAQETIISPQSQEENLFNTVLDPACGDGNFLAEILQQRLSKAECPLTSQYIFLALSTIYGIELLGDNVRDCRNRLLEIVKTYNSNNDFLKGIEFVLKKNVIQGDSLELIETKGIFPAIGQSATPHPKLPIIFSCWGVALSAPTNTTCNFLIQRKLEAFFQMIEGSSEPYKFPVFSFVDLQNLDFQNQMDKEEEEYKAKKTKEFENYKSLFSPQAKIKKQDFARQDKMKPQTE